MVVRPQRVASADHPEFDPVEHGASADPLSPLPWLLSSVASAHTLLRSQDSGTPEPHSPCTRNSTSSGKLPDAVSPETGATMAALSEGPSAEH